MFPTASCPLCDRDWLLVYPVRYAVACPRGAARAPALSGNFRIDARAPQSVATARYTLRAPRPGYLYAYDEKRRRLSAYMVLEDGILWRFPPGVLPPPADLENELTRGCVANGELKFETFGRCVDIEHKPGDEATNWWFGWSNVVWTKALIAKIHDPDWRRRHMQCIDVPAMLEGNAPHTGEFRTTCSRIAHFAMDEHAMTEAFGFSNRDPRSEVRQRRLHLAKRIGDAMATLPTGRGFVVALDDPVGMTNDLAELTVPSAHTGFDEELYWKLISANLLEKAEAGIRANASNAAGLSYGSSRTISDLNLANIQARTPVAPDPVGFFHVMRSWIKTGSLDRALKDEQRKIDDVCATQRQAADEAWAEASTSTGPDGKRVSLLDEEALKRFPQEYQRAFDAFNPQLQGLIQAHADWLKSPLLAQWMNGVHDQKDLRSGYAYSESCAQAIGAGVGTGACRKVLDDWLKTQASNIGNLYGRALLFNHEDLMKAADAQMHGSDIQYENLLNIYQGAQQRVKKLGDAAGLRDRLVVVTANYVVDTLAKTARSAAIGFVLIRLSLQSGVSIKASRVNRGVFRNWLLDEGKAVGVTFEGNRTQQRAMAMRVSKEVLKAAPPSDPDVLLYHVDTDALVRKGKLGADSVKVVRIPGVETTRKWLGSSTPETFHLGVATFVFQMVALRFAIEDVAKSDELNNGENVTKVLACGLSIIGNLMKTVAETVQVAPEHPLAAFIMRQWAVVGRNVKTIEFAGRTAGLLGGLILSALDFIKNMPEAFFNKNIRLTFLYFSNGALNAYIAIAIFNGLLDFLWIFLIMSILASIVIAKYKASELSSWISRCKFGKGTHYHSLKAELQAFNSAVKG